MIANQYSINKSLGQGGMGQVYLAFDKVLKRHVAIKTLLDDPFGDTAAEERFEQEAQIVAALEHPSIVTIHQYGVDQFEDNQPRLPYIVMQYMPGGTLAERLKMHLNHKTFLPIRECIEIVYELAEALDYAHSC